MMFVTVGKGVLQVFVVVGVLLVTQTVCCPDKCVCNSEQGIQTVTCSHANLTTLPENIPTDTLELHIQSNNISTLRNDSFLNLTSLERLYLENNQIRHIEQNAFKGLGRLHVLKLSDNPVGDINNIFGGLGNLEELELNNCGLTSVGAASFSELANLKCLNLDSNHFESFMPEMFEGLTSLEELSVEENRLTGIPSLSVSVSSSLKELCLGGNQMSAMDGKPFMKFDRLETLHLSSVSPSGGFPDDVFEGIEDTLTELNIAANDLTSVPQAVRKLTNLRILDMSDNKVQEFTYEIAMGLLDLETLSLSRNRFRDIPSEVLPMYVNLMELLLDDNDITSVPSKAFSACTLLQTISLKNNQITKIGNDAFRGLSNMKSIDLSGNNLTTISDSLFAGTSGISLALNQNPWQCDCRVLWLAKWNAEGKINYGKVIPVCETPSSLKDQNMLDLTKAMLTDCKAPIVTSDITPTVMATLGTSVIIPCEMVGFPTPVTSWYNTNGKVVTNDSPSDTNDNKYMTQNTSLKINNIEPSDQGKYTCWGRNIVGNASVEITVVIRTEQTSSISPGVTVNETSSPPMHPTVRQRSKSKMGGSEIGILVFGSFAAVTIGVSALVHWYCKKREREADEEHQSIAFDNRTFSAFDDSDVEII